MTTTNPHPNADHHLARAAELAAVADRKIIDGIYEGGDTEFVRTIIELAELHLHLATAAASVPFMVRAQFGAERPADPCRFGPNLRHAPHDGCPGALMAEPS